MKTKTVVMIALSLTLALGLFAGIDGITPNANAAVCTGSTVGPCGEDDWCVPSGREFDKCY
jgi:hypothetical protein